jgi:hypothetical protein
LAGFAEKAKKTVLPVSSLKLGQGNLQHKGDYPRETLILNIAPLVGR